jgi:hypothetical protein
MYSTEGASRADWREAASREVTLTLTQSLKSQYILRKLLLHMQDIKTLSLKQENVNWRVI